MSMRQPAWRKLRVRELALPVDNCGADALQTLTAKRLGMAASDLGEVIVRQRALDARQRPPRYVFAVDVEVPASQAQRLVQANKAEPIVEQRRYRYFLHKPPKGPQPVVVGAGPAGLFAALTLAEAGWPPLLIERGRPVEPRAHDVSRLYRTGELDLDSNVCYGEGGAGTFSDGKLYTRVGDARVRHVMMQLVARGADPDILIDNRPHLGTDRLVALMQSFRTHLLSLGATLRFETAVDDFVINDGVLAGVRLRDGEHLDASNVVLASGHSAREIWLRLQASGLPLELRTFAVGFRVEHPQAFVNAVRYGKGPSVESLPAADYRLTYNDRQSGRGVYSFCMCPGGVVVATPTRAEELCINGMSHASRAGRFANSALVVSVGPADFAAGGFGDDVFAGVRLQEASEQAAYRAGGGAFVAPAARLTDFLAGKESSTLPATSYRRGVTPADLHSLYPPIVSEALSDALRHFERRMRGFISDEAKLIGVETRTASPVRVPRGDDLQALGARGLYPAGEGMGYGGGIVSAAVDGVRTAQALLQAVGAETEERSQEDG